jgi:ubiquinone biosynthesis protein
VHYAVLRSGKPVAVKVQRPNVREQVAEDLEAMAEIAEMLDHHTEFGKRFLCSSIIEELRKSLLRELDYRMEAANLRLMREQLAQFDKLLVPAPIDDYSTGRVLTMEYVSGHKITQLHPVTRIDLDGDMLAEEVFRAYLHQILVVGVFHADPHPGNVFLTEDHRIALLDLGMIGRIGPTLQEQLLRLLLAMSDGQSDRAAEMAEKMGVPRDGYDQLRFRREISEVVSQQLNASLSDIQTGKVLMRITRIAADTNLRVPAELTLLGKTLLNLDLVGRTLSPSFDPNESIRRNAADILRHRTVKSFTPGNMLNTMLEAKEFIENLPARLNHLLDLIAGNKLQVRVDALDENLLMSGLQKIANRITLGLILAALIVGAALLMRVNTDFRILGYPGFAMLCFVLASAGGVALALQILRSDTRPK